MTWTGFRGLKARLCDRYGAAARDPAMRSQVFRALLAALVAVTAATSYGLFRPDLSLHIEMKSTTGPSGEVFLAAADAGYSPERSVPFPVVPDGRWHRYSVALPSTSPTDRVRIDPGTGAGDVSVRALVLREPLASQEFRGSTLLSAVGVTNHLQRAATDSEVLSFTSEGVDPYFEIRLAETMGGASLSTAIGNFALIGLTAFFAWLLLERIAHAMSRAHSLRKVEPAVAKVAGFLSDGRVLRVNGPMLLTVACLMVLAMLYVGLRLNQSSIGLWETVYPDVAIDQPIELGTPKRIRSDEWRVHTPWVLNQVLSGSPMQNRNVGGASSPLFTALPVPGVIGLPQLKLAGFRLFGVETGFSWWWAYKSFALVGSFLWLCLLLTRGNLAASMLGAAWIHTSSFTQWWFSSLLPEIMIAFALGVTGAIYALFSDRRGHIVAGCALALYAATNLALHLYPPFVVPLAYLGVVVLGAYAVQYRALALPLHRPWFRGTAIAITAAMACVYGALFIAQAWDTIELMRNTVYPGQRVSESGGVPLAKLAYGFFEAIRLGETNFPLPPTNASEASSFVMLAPLALLVVPWRALLRRDSALLAGLGGFCLIAIAWISFEIPATLERIMQSAGWSLVTPKRAVLALGVGSVLACVTLFARTQEDRHPVRSEIARRMSVVAVCLGLVVLGWGLRQMDPMFFTWKVITIGAVASGLLAAGMALGRIALMAAGIAIYALTTMAVNPLVSGIAALSEKPVLLTARRASSNPGDKWAVIGDTNFAQGLKAHGLSVFAGSQFLPDKQSISILDPTGAYEKVWNRYSTIEVKSDPARASALFRARRGDQYWISLNVCGGQLSAVGVTHLAYTIDVPREDLACLEPLAAPADSGVRLFRLKGQGRPQPAS